MPEPTAHVWWPSNNVSRYWRIKGPGNLVPAQDFSVPCYPVFFLLFFRITLSIWSIIGTLSHWPPKILLIDAFVTLSLPRDFALDRPLSEGTSGGVK